MRMMATAYGPPWTGINGTGVTATGVDLRGSPHKFIVAVDPKIIPLHTKLVITPNPFDGPGIFQAEDTGSVIKGARIDFYDWRGRSYQYDWGERWVTVTVFGSTPTVAAPPGGVPGNSGFPHVPANEPLPPGGAPSAGDYSALIRSSRINIGRIGAYLQDAGDAIRRTVG